MDLRSAMAQTCGHLEQLLTARGLLDRSGGLLCDDELEARSPDLKLLIGDYVENFAELRGLLAVGRAIRKGEAVSDIVVSAAWLMTDGVCAALERVEALDR